MSDEPVKKCPECGKQVRRLVSGGIGVIFKGSGFYVTDKDKANTPKADTASKDGGASKADTAKEGGASKEGEGAKADLGSKNDAAPKADTASKTKGKAKPAA